MIHYVRLEVQIHGLSEPNVAAVLARVERALEAEFRPSFASDLVVEADESAGTEE